MLVAYVLHQTTMQTVSRDVEPVRTDHAHFGSWKGLTTKANTKMSSKLALLFPIALRNMLPNEDPNKAL